MPSKDLLSIIYAWFARSFMSRSNSNKNNKTTEDIAISNVLTPESALADLQSAQKAAHLGDSYGKTKIDVPLVDYSDKIARFRKALQDSYNKR